MPDPSFRLMSRMTQAAASKSVWFLKASADENRMGTYACARSRRSSPSSIPESSSTTKTRFRSCKARDSWPVRRRGLRPARETKIRSGPSTRLGRLWLSFSNGRMRRRARLSFRFFGFSNCLLWRSSILATMPLLSQRRQVLLPCLKCLYLGVCGALKVHAEPEDRDHQTCNARCHVLCDLETFVGRELLYFRIICLDFDGNRRTIHVAILRLHNSNRRGRTACTAAQCHYSSDRSQRFPP